MAYTPIEIIAWILIIITAVKLLTISTNPDSWRRFTKTIYGNPRYSRLFSLTFAFIILYYLLQELTIVQILATSLFVTMLILYGFLSMGSELLKISDKLYKKYGNKILRKYWLYTLIWVVLLIYGAMELLNIKIPF